MSRSATSTPSWHQVAAAGPRHDRTTDQADARSVALVALRAPTLAHELLADLRRLDRRLAANRGRCQDLLAVRPSRLPEVFGISAVLTVKLVGLSIAIHLVARTQISRPGPGRT